MTHLLGNQDNYYMQKLKAIILRLFRCENQTQKKVITMFYIYDIINLFRCKFYVSLTISFILTNKLTTFLTNSLRDRL